MKYRDASNELIDMINSAANKLNRTLELNEKIKMKIKPSDLKKFNKDGDLLKAFIHLYLFLF